MRACDWLNLAITLSPCGNLVMNKCVQCYAVTTTRYSSTRSEQKGIGTSLGIRTCDQERILLIDCRCLYCVHIIPSASLLVIDVCYDLTGVKLIVLAC